MTAEGNSTDAIHAALGKAFSAAKDPEALAKVVNEKLKGTELQVKYSNIGGKNFVAEVLRQTKDSRAREDQALKLADQDTLKVADDLAKMLKPLTKEADMTDAQEQQLRKAIKSAKNAELLQDVLNAKLRNTGISLDVSRVYVSNQPNVRFGIEVLWITETTNIRRK